MNGWPLRHVVSVKMRAFIYPSPPSIVVAGRACLLRFSAVMSLVVTAKAVTHLSLHNCGRFRCVCLAINQSLRNILWITESCRSFSISAVIFRSLLPRTRDRVSDHGGSVYCLVAACLPAFGIVAEFVW